MFIIIIYNIMNTKGVNDWAWLVLMFTYLKYLIAFLVIRESLMDQNLVTLYIYFPSPTDTLTWATCPADVVTSACAQQILLRWASARRKWHNIRRLKYGGMVRGNIEILGMSRGLNVGRLGYRIIMGPNAEVHGLIYRWQRGGGGGGGVGRWHLASYGGR